MPANQHDQLREYLLGGLSPEERDAVSRQYFESEASFEDIEAAEDDLIESYLRNELSGPDRIRFEERFLEVPELRERIDQARELRRALAGVSGKRRAITVPWAIAAAACVGLALLAGTWFHTKPALESEVRQLRAELDRERARLETLAPGAFVETVVSLESRVTRSSSAATNEVRTVPGTNLVRLQLPVRADPQYASYQASMTDADAPAGAPPLLIQTALFARSDQGVRIVELQIPAAVLPPGDYVLSLDGVNAGSSERLHSYAFRVVHQQGPTPP